MAKKKKFHFPIKSIFGHESQNQFSGEQQQQKKMTIPHDNGGSSLDQCAVQLHCKSIYSIHRLSKVERPMKNDKMGMFSISFCHFLSLLHSLLQQSTKEDRRMQCSGDKPVYVLGDFSETRPVRIPMRSPAKMAVIA